MTDERNGESIADDLLEGAGAIAKFLYGKDSSSLRRKVYYFASEAKGSRLPVFHLSNTICARRSTLLDWIANQERRSAGLNTEAA